MIRQEALNSAIHLLKSVRQETDTIGVALSLGKDSLTTLDLCTKIFDDVKAFYLYRVYGLSYVEKWRKYVKKRWNIDIMMLPHFDLSRLYRNSVLQPHWIEARKTPIIKFSDVENYFRKKANVTWIAYGYRRNESISRAIQLKIWRGLDIERARVFPIWQWRRKEVYEYLEMNDIPFPETFGRKDQGGLDFHRDVIMFLRNNKSDWKKITRDFPFVGAQLYAKRRAKRRKEMEKFLKIWRENPP